MQVDFAKQAYDLNVLSLADLKEKQYFLSWGRSFEARLYFVADIIVQMAQVSWALLKATYSAMIAFYTWDSDRLDISDLSQHTHQLIFSLFGVLTPYFATKWKDVSLREKLGSFVKCLLPSRLILSAKGGISFSWPLTQRPSPAKINKYT